MAIAAALYEIVGTIVAQEMPLMAAGLDSIAAGEFVNYVAVQLSTELPQMTLFDHPTVGALASVVASTTESLDSFSGATLRPASAVT